MFKWLVEKEPVWFASAVMALVGFAVFVAGKYGFDPEIGNALMTLLPVLLAPLTRRATSSNDTVRKVAEVAAATGDADMATKQAGVKPAATEVRP